MKLSSFARRSLALTPIASRLYNRLLENSGSGPAGGKVSDPVGRDRAVEFGGSRQVTVYASNEAGSASSAKVTLEAGSESDPSKSATAVATIAKQAAAWKRNPEAQKAMQLRLWRSLEGTSHIGAR